MLASILAVVHLSLVAFSAPVSPELVGSTTYDSFPPTGTQVNTALFPDQDVVGYPQTTRTGAEAFAFQTAPAAQFPMVQDLFGPVVLPKAKGKVSHGFQPIKSWGYMTPRYSLPRDTFGACKASPIVPEQCKLTAVHLLMRHGARYPTAGEESSNFATRLGEAARNGEFTGTGELSFLNTWTYKLGTAILHPFGRQQCYDLGVRSRMAYGHLLNDFVEKGTLPVFRTGSIDRMVDTMESFAQGFFGRDSEKQYSLTIAVESKGINATVSASKLGQAEFVNKVFASTAKRLQKSAKGGYKFTPADVLAMLSLCSYETLALGYSKFCPLFTQQDFDNMQYAFDIMFYYGNGPGGQTTAAQGKGWVQEFLARLTHTPIPVYDSSTNSTLNGNPETFPLNQTIYADASHDSYIMSTFTALNFSVIDTYGRLPTNVKRGPKRSFMSSHLVPFNTNLVVQVMSCDGVEKPQLRFAINDAVVPLDQTYNGCEPNDDGLCDVDTVVAALNARMDEIDYHRACNGEIVNVTETSQLRDGNGLPW